MNKIGTKTLNTSRLILRKITIEDVKDIYEYASKEETSKFLTRKPHKSIKETKEYVKNVASRYEESIFRWGIVDKSENKLIGVIDVVKIDEINNECEIGYVLNPKYWRQGIMKEALSQVLDYLFKEVRFDQINAKVELGNIASEKVLLANDFKTLETIISVQLPFKDDKIVLCKCFYLKK